MSGNDPGKEENNSMSYGVLFSWTPLVTPKRCGFLWRPHPTKKKTPNQKPSGGLRMESEQLLQAPTTTDSSRKRLSVGASAMAVVVNPKVGCPFKKKKKKPMGGRWSHWRGIGVFFFWSFPPPIQEELPLGLEGKRKRFKAGFVVCRVETNHARES